MLHDVNAADNQRLAYFLGSEKAGGKDDGAAAAPGGNGAGATTPGAAAAGGNADHRQAANVEAADRPLGPPDVDGMDDTDPSCKTWSTLTPTSFHGGACLHGLHIMHVTV